MLLIFKKGELISKMLTAGLIHISGTLYNAVPSTWKSFCLYVGLANFFFFFISNVQFLSFSPDSVSTLLPLSCYLLCTPLLIYLSHYVEITY